MINMAIEPMFLSYSYTLNTDHAWEDGHFLLVVEQYPHILLIRPIHTLLIRPIILHLSYSLFLPWFPSI